MIKNKHIAMAAIVIATMNGETPRVVVPIVQQVDSEIF
jgi:hypothetical protein